MSVELALRERLSTLLSGSFLRDVMKLSFGTITGRVITVAAMPLLTRLYSPSDFNLLAAYLAIVGIVVVGACLRLDVAIPLATNDDDAANLLALALISLGVVVIVTLLFIISIPIQLANWLGFPELETYLWLVPLGIAFASSYSVFQLWATRAHKFGRIARTRVGQAISGISVMLSLGWFGFTPIGLLLGNILNIGAGGFSLGLLAFWNDREKLRAITPDRMKETLKTYRNYPLYSTPDALLNIAGAQVPILIIAAHSGTEAGFLLLAMQVMITPMSLLGSSISQVYMSRSPDEYKAKNLAPFTLSIMKQLVIVGVGPLVLVGVLAPIIFPWVFGDEWARAGTIVTWIVPWMVLQFIVAPVSMVIYVAGHQRSMLVLTFLGAFLRIGGVLTCLSSSHYEPIIGLVFGSVTFYVVMIAIVFRAAGAGMRQIIDLLKSVASLLVVIPVTFAIIISVIF